MTVADGFVVALVAFCAFIRTRIAQWMTDAL